MPDQRITGTYDKLSADIEKVKKIPIVPTMLDVICETTGMGFAAIARVTEDKWITCGVRDDIRFGLKPGDELKIETTICNEIRDSRKAVIIDHVDKDDIFAHHHTPLMYKFQSYISMPIILKNGDFFGTLCAIDPQPAQLNNPKTIGMFTLFAELISFHLNSLDLIEQSNAALSEMNKQLTYSIDENRQYQYISNHNLQEPLRKIRLFSNMLIDAVETKDTDKANNLALKIDRHAQKISMMIKDLSDFSELNYADESFTTMELNKVIADVCAQLMPQIKTRKAVVNVASLPVISAIPSQIEQLFYHLINNALKFSKREVAPVIDIRSSVIDQYELPGGKKYVEIRISDNGIGIEQSQLEKIFDIFSQLPNNNEPLHGFGVGLAYCRKIIRNHGGSISAQSEHGIGTTFSIILPVK